VTDVRRRLAVSALAFGGLAFVSVLAAPLVGTTPISLQRVFDGSVPFADNVDAQIFFIARLPRAIAGALVGATLAAAGVVFQALLRNPLATPFTLGVSAGAALGAMLAITLRLHLSLWGVSAVTAASFIGSLGAVAIVYAMARARHRGFSTNVLLLAGVTLNAFFSALILFVQYLADSAEALRTMRWLMGDLDIAGYGPLVAALPLCAIAFVAFAWLPRPLNLLSLDTDAGLAWRGRTARAARGVLQRIDGHGRGGVAWRSHRLHRHHRAALVRLMVGSDHRVVLPASALFGAAFLVATDVVARTVMAPVELPVGIITALVGGPFFLWLLVRQR